MSESSASTNHHCSFEVELVIFVSEIDLQIFITHEIAGVSWRHPQSHNVHSFPKA